KLFNCSSTDPSHVHGILRYFSDTSRKLASLRILERLPDSANLKRLLSPLAESVPVSNFCRYFSTIEVVVVKRGFSLDGPQVTSAITPMFFRTLRASLIALPGSEKNMTPNRQVTASNDSSGKGRTSASATLNSIFER